MSENMPDSQNQSQISNPTNNKLLTVLKSGPLPVLLITLVVVGLGGAVVANSNILNQKKSDEKVATKSSGQKNATKSATKSADITPEPTLPTPPPPPPPQANPPATQFECNGGSVSGSNCLYTFDVTKTQSRLTAYSVQMTPSVIQLYTQIPYTVTCSVVDACTDHLGSVLTMPYSNPSVPGHIDMYFAKNTSVTVTVPKEVSSGGSIYKFNEFIYSMNPQGACPSGTCDYHSVRSNWDKK